MSTDRNMGTPVASHTTPSGTEDGGASSRSTTDVTFEVQTNVLPPMETRHMEAMVTANLLFGGGTIIVRCKGCGSFQSEGPVTRWKVERLCALAHSDECVADVPTAITARRWPTPDRRWHVPATVCPACIPQPDAPVQPCCARCGAPGKTPFCSECVAAGEANVNQVTVEVLCYECGNAWQHCLCMPLSYDAYRVYF